MTPPIEICSRTEAAARGMRFFNTGRPCSQGHTSPRFVSNGTCVACSKMQGKAARRNVNRGRNARLRGHFSYDLHPDDHASALAFCQALDMQRGIMPKTPAPAPVPRRITQAEIQAIHDGLTGRIVDRTFPPMDN